MVSDGIPKLRGLPTDQGPKIDWQPLEPSIAAGKAAAEDRDYGTAVVRYAEAIRGVMHQLRQHRLKSTDDSSVAPA